MKLFFLGDVKLHKTHVIKKIKIIKILELLKNKDLSLSCTWLQDFIKIDLEKKVQNT